MQYKIFEFIQHAKADFDKKRPVRSPRCRTS